MKKHISIVLAVLVTTALNSVSLRILHTNDTHAAYQATDYKTSDGSTIRLGGYSALEYHLNQQRESISRSIYLDAGDQQTGSVFSSMEYEGLKGGAVLETFRLLRLDVATLGNHEFDISYEHARALVKSAAYPFVSANLLDSDHRSFGRAAYSTISFDSLDIGVIGLTLVELPEKVKTENVAPLTILPYKAALDRILNEVDRNSDLIILLTHNGWEADSLLATMLDDRVDMIIGGHSHIAIQELTQVNGIYILSAGSHLMYLGAADIEVRDDRIASFASSLIPLSPPPEGYRSQLTEFIEETAGELEVALGKVVGISPFAFTVDKYSVTPSSRWVAEALLKEYEDFAPDLAMINNGGLRKNIPAGPVTLRDLHEYIPFGNTVTFFSCYGRDILTFDKYNLQNAIHKPYDILSTSAPGWMYLEDNEAAVLVDQAYFNLGKEILEPDKIYRVVAHDYVVGQADKYLGFRPFDIYDTGDLFLDAIIRQVEKQFSR
jgi:2',3'-cyclic-nucleotide 2'-phosphodiesterase (5'-nucleotidase family)